MHDINSKIPRTHIPTIGNATFSKRVNGMYLGVYLSSWNIIMLVCLGATAIAAFGVVVATRAVIVLQDDAEKEAKRDLENIKPMLQARYQKLMLAGIKQKPMPRKQTSVLLLLKTKRPKIV